jgi:hypothetical protein
MKANSTREELRVIVKNLQNSDDYIGIKTEYLEQAIATLIQRKQLESKIYELKLHAPDWVVINEDGSVNPSVVYDRIAELEALKVEL